MDDYIDIESLRVDSLCSFAETIRGVIKRFGDQKFTQQHIVAVLKNEEYNFEGKNPKSCVSPNLARFALEGGLEVIKLGSGRGPTIYKNRNI